MLTGSRGKLRVSSKRHAADVYLWPKYSTDHLSLFRNRTNCLLERSVLSGWPQTEPSGGGASKIACYYILLMRWYFHLSTTRNRTQFILSSSVLCTSFTLISIPYRNCFLLFTPRMFSFYFLSLSFFLSFRFLPSVLINFSSAFLLSILHAYIYNPLTVI
jgi:hypothetical protein